MAVLDLFRGSDETKPPPQVQERIRRGRDRMVEGAPRRNECLRFWRGDQYVFVNGDNFLVKQSTVTNQDGSGKPRHRVRTVRNLIVDIVAHEVSAGTQRVPSYDVSPSSTAPDRISAARLAEKVALYGYDQWRLRDAIERVVTFATVADEGFAWPIFDNTIGPFISDGEKSVGVGDIRVRLFGGNEVMWEPGVPFDDSRWLAIEQARPLDEVYAMDGYTGGKLTPNASSSDVADGAYNTEKPNLVLVTEYLERPSAKTPNGMWLVLAEGRQICAPRAYPCRDGKGTPVDEPVLHKLSYFLDPAQDRDMGLVRHLLDAQRTYNDCVSKQLEWKNLALNHQVWALPGAIQTRLTDAPGAVFTVTDLNAVKDRDVPAIPADLGNLMDQARGDMARIAAQNDIPGQVEAGKAITVLTERDANRRQAFVARLAEFHSRLMRHCLYLVQRHYTEERLLKIRGPFGTEVATFRGADLLSEVDVRVLPASIEPLTQEGIEAQIEMLATYFPGTLTPDMALAAISGRSLDSINATYSYNVEKQQREIQQALALIPTLAPGAPPEAFGKAAVPIAAMWDEDEVHLTVLHQFMETEEFDDLPDAVKEVLATHELQHKEQQRQKAAEAAQAQLVAAESQGMANAAKDQPPPQAPSKPMPQ